MPMTPTSVSEVIKPVVTAPFESAVWRNNVLLKHFPAPVGPFGDTAYRWPVNYAGNTSVETYTSGQAQPDAGEQSWIKAAHSYQYWRYMIEIDHIAEDSLLSNYVDAVAAETELGNQDLVDLITTTFLSTLETIVDSTTTYAGLTRSAGSYWASSETAVSRALAVQDMLDLIEAMRDNDKGSNFGPGRGLWLMPLNQATNVYALIGQPAEQQIPDGDKAPGYFGQAFARIPIVDMPDMTDTVIMALDMTPGKWMNVRHRALRVDFQGRSGDASIYQVSYGGQLVDRRPFHDGKLTGVTA